MLQSLGFSAPTFVFTIINIVILTLIFRAFLFKPVTRFMEKREQAVRDDIEQAEAAKSDAQSLKADYEEKLKNAQTEAEGIIREARDAAQKQADRIVADGRTEAQKLVADARSRIEAEKRAALAAFRAEAAALVIAAAGRLLRNEIGSAESMRQASLILRELENKG
jgi:F-type H+-transporting ATPase subunit b